MSMSTVLNLVASLLEERARTGNFAEVWLVGVLGTVWDFLGVVGWKEEHLVLFFYCSLTFLVFFGKVFYGFCLF